MWRFCRAGGADMAVTLGVGLDWRQIDFGVNPRLTLSRVCGIIVGMERHRTINEYSGFVRRILRAISARIVADGNVEELRQLVELRETIDGHIAGAVAELRCNGATWQEIATGLSGGRDRPMSRQSAEQRYGQLARERAFHLEAS